MSVEIMLTYNVSYKERQPADNEDSHHCSQGFGCFCLLGYPADVGAGAGAGTKRREYPGRRMPDSPSHPAGQTYPGLAPS